MRMKKLLLLLMVLLPSLCFAASGVLTAKGKVNGLPINKGESWEVWCDQSKKEINFQNWSNGTLIKCTTRGGMSVNSALNYDVYIDGQHKGNVWIYVKIDGDEIKDLYIKTFYGITYFE